MSDARKWACEGKQGFTAEMAQHIAERNRRKRKERVSAYRCRHCGRWHYGHTGKRSQRWGER